MLRPRPTRPLVVMTEIPFRAGSDPTAAADTNSLAGLDDP
jgi:hypothetical protein